MQNSFGLSIAASLIYTLLCFIDMRFIQKESVPFKTQFRNSFFVFVATMLGIQLLKSIGEDVGEVVTGGGGSVTAFTGAPGF